MNEPLSPRELRLVQEVLRGHPQITEARLFGSRAKGTHSPHSDIDLALWGELDALQTEEIAAQLDELPLPWHFDVLPFAQIQSPPLREHIERVGLSVYPPPSPLPLKSLIQPIVTA